MENIKITTISIDADIHLTAKINLPKQHRGNFSGYLQELVEKDLKERGVKTIKGNIDELQ